MLREALRTRDLETLYLSPAARRLLQDQADPTDRSDESNQYGRAGGAGQADHG